MNRGHFTPRKKHKIHGPSVVGAMKYVRINANTEIMVPVNVPDEEAIARYLERINRPVRGPWNRATTNTPNLPLREEYKESEIAVEELEELLQEEKAAELPDDE